MPLCSLLRVINKVEVETGFPGIPTIKESEGGGEGRLFDGACLTFWSREWALPHQSFQCSPHITFKHLLHGDKGCS